MHIERNLRPSFIWQKYGWRPLLIFLTYDALIGFMYGPLDIHWLDIPWQPVATLGTAVAFYIGFKSNASYSRFWEARQLWGSVVNSSRTWTGRVLDFVRTPDEDYEYDSAEREAHRRLVYRHIAWVNALRLHLRRQTAELWQTEVVPFLLDPADHALGQTNNPPAQLVIRQGHDMRRLSFDGMLTEFREVSMAETLRELNNHQGACERIKNTPFPRQYAFFSYVFVMVFAILLPLGLVEEFDSRVALGPYHVWLMVPFATLVSWVFHTIEKVGHNSENPFENKENDVSMSSICRSIEIDLRQMLAETNLPAPVKPVEDVLY
jgi:putative membrane protein